MKKTNIVRINLGSGYTRKDGTSTAGINLEKFIKEHPNAVREDYIDLRSEKVDGTVYDLYFYDYFTTWNYNSYARRMARFVERKEA